MKPQRITYSWIRTGGLAEQPDGFHFTIYKFGNKSSKRERTARVMLGGAQFSGKMASFGNY